MTIKRKLTRETITKTRKLAILRNAENIECRVCERCEDSPPMLEPNSIRQTYDVSERDIFWLIENDRVHFLEADTNRIFVCLLTLREAIASESKSKAADK